TQEIQDDSPSGAPVFARKGWQRSANRAARWSLVEKNISNIPLLSPLSSPRKRQGRFRSSQNSDLHSLQVCPNSIFFLCSNTQMALPLK
ncbi:MAG: hypothetical protein ACPH79_02510, partial [Paracoccaceae bacterium]